MDRTHMFMTRVLSGIRASLNEDNTADPDEVWGVLRRAIFLYETGDKKEETKTLLEEACRLGSLRAAVFLGAIYLEEGKEGRAMILFELACARGEQLGCRGLEFLEEKQNLGE